VIKKSSKIFVTGHKGLVGSAIIRKLKKSGYRNILVVDRKRLDLTRQKEVESFIKKNKPNSIINAAARVGGIAANNKYKADFIYNNIAIQNNIIHSSYINNVKNLVFLGSSCVYPKMSKQPIKEEYLLSGPLEKTNEPYAVAKISGIKMCESYNYQYGTNYKCLMPCNTYGPNDNYDLNTSHFYPALISKIHKAKVEQKKSITLWGTGKAKRELMYVDDVADACIFFLHKKTKETLINIGTGKEKTINEYAKFIMSELNIRLKIIYDKSKPDGTPRKILNVSTAKKYGWSSKVSLKDGFFKVYKTFLKI
tara:strand:+ start:17999 stop:18925 length:927 start_codon:yes stop_codon:yes gene_type:complete